jgi:hypothetical protein
VYHLFHASNAPTMKDTHVQSDPRNRHAGDGHPRLGPREGFLDPKPDCHRDAGPDHRCYPDPLPLALASGFVLGIILVAQAGGAPPQQADLVKYALPLELGIVLLCFIVALIIALINARPAKEVLKEELGLPREGLDLDYRERFAPQPPPEEGIERKDDRMQ